MSWAEVYKINSDFANEPLNYTNYIYDISVFGLESYVMDQNNKKIWDEMALYSCYLYGHTGIHEYVYERLTEENVDRLWNISGKLGRQLNNFHNTTVYADGAAKEVLAAMTMDSYNDLIDKIRWGYQRYVNGFLSAESGVGQWIFDIFGVDVSAYETAADIINSEEAWNLVLLSEPVMVALTSSEYVMNLIATSDIATERFADAIYYAGQNEKAINVIANYDSLVQQVVNDQTSMEWIASSENAMMTMLSVENFTTQALASEVAMNAMAESLTAVNLICDFVKNVQISQNAMIKIDADITDIETWITSILNGSDISGKLTAAHTAIDTAVDATNAVTEHANIVDNMAMAIASNETFCLDICSNKNMCDALYENQKDNSVAPSIIISGGR